MNAIPNNTSSSCCEMAADGVCRVLAIECTPIGVAPNVIDGPYCSCTGTVGTTVAPDGFQFLLVITPPNLN
ncbi:hypothetical protein BLOT_006760 [Blomia tropicalis]|nr:hypothetical protein BLOT_006760 [Blomia tropicalis]